MAMSDDLIERLLREVPSGMMTIGSGGISSDGKVTLVPSKPIMKLANPDGPEAADRIASLEAEVREARELLESAQKPRFGEPGYVAPEQPRHVFVAHPKYPWFCKVCGYPSHETLFHRDATKDTP